MGESLLLQSAKRWKDLSLNSDRKLKITVIDREAIDKMESLKLRHPKLAEICDLNPLQMDIESPEFQRAKFLFKNEKYSNITNIFICLNNDSFGLATALVLQNQMKDKKIPVVIRMETDGGLATLLGEKSAHEEFMHLKAFGLLDRTCEPELLLGGVNETLARVAHQEYASTQLEAGETNITNPAIVPWEELNEEIEKLSELEHRRWNAERSLAGWIFSKQKDDKTRETPYLTDWNKLPEDIKNYDRNTVKNIPSVLELIGMKVVKKETFK